MEFPYWGLFFSLLLLAAPLAVFWRLGGGMLRSSAVAIGRMAVQLLFVAIYMEWLYALNSIAADLAWMVLMTAAAAFSLVSHSCLSRKKLLLPVAGGLFASVVLVGLYLLVAVMRPAKLTDTHWTVPVFGLLLSGVQSVGKAVLEAFYSGLRHNSAQYYFLLGNGASHREAVLPFIKGALQKGYAPLLTSVSAVGIATMPDMMMGAMLGGVAPATAAVWQTGVLAGILAAPAVFTAVALYLADSLTFDRCGRLRNVFRQD